MILPYSSGVNDRISFKKFLESLFVTSMQKAKMFCVN